MASKLWEPLETEEALEHGWQLVKVTYHHRKPVSVEILEKHPKWTEQDIRGTDVIE